MDVLLLLMYNEVESGPMLVICFLAYPYVTTHDPRDAERTPAAVLQDQNSQIWRFIPCFPHQGLGENLQLEKGWELFSVLNQQGLHPDQFSYVAVFGICTMKEDLFSGQGLHCQTIKVGLNRTAFVGNVILTMYSKCGTIDDVENTFISIKQKDVITCNTYIAAYSYFGEHDKSLMIYRKMEEAYGLNPDNFTLAGALAACSDLSYVRYGTQMHGRLIRAIVELDVGVFNAIMNMYAKCGWIKYANRIFHCMPNRNLVSWNTIITALGYHGLGRIAIQVFEEMNTSGVKPDSATFTGLLAACNHAGLVDEGKTYFDSMEEIYGNPPKIEHLSCVIDLLGRASRLEEAEAHARMFPFGNDSVIWGSLLSSCRLHGNLVVGERVARKLLELQPTTSSPFVLLSTLYASYARWDSVSMTWKLLKGSGVKKEPGYSLVVVNDLPEKFTVGNSSHARIEEILETLRNLNLEAKRVSSQIICYSRN
ncbi:pentatricopeptide repeat-containing protein At5g04780-like isoform X2 [Phalaenopsis equestris]|uniref:pentatricopeptide repeat-containing protein At5g04780-like isoform X2 n=1 Tax=Phalaenopsis equestris TaxID=78828 RepID=UPI0009E5BFE4|nr:pentatricopeptide repeat-containing protein At5g04780-like isoform X2 [Phalaenopsis equestris]